MKIWSQVFRSILLWAAFLSVSASALKGEDASVLYRHHSVGSTTFLQATQGTTFREVWKLNETEEIRRQVYQSIGRILIGKFAGGPRLSPTNAHPSLPILSAMLSDMVENESWMDVRGADEKLEWLLAVRLPEARRKAWTTGIEQVLAQNQLGALTPADFSGTRGVQAKVSKGVFEEAIVGEWILLGYGPKAPASWNATLSSLQKTGRPLAPLTNSWFQISADLTRLRKTFPLIPEFAGSKLDLSFTGKGEGVRTDAKLHFASSLRWKPEPWNLPTNAIKDPLVGFSAARGIESILKRNEESKLLGFDSYPNQACAWSLAYVPYFTFAAVPMNGVSNVMWRGLPHLPQVITNHGKLSGQLMWVTNNTQIVWQGMPIVTPVARPLFDGNREFLMVGMMPPPSNPQRPPMELFEFLKKPNLALYDWEITEERLNAWRKIYLMGLLGFMRESPVTNAPTQRILDVLGQGKRLGNCITEISVTGDSEITFMRHANIGLTGLEIVSLLRYIDSSNFPFTWERTPLLDLKKLSLENRAKRQSNAPNTAPKSVTPYPPSRQIPGRTNAVVRPQAAPVAPPQPKPQPPSP